MRTMIWMAAVLSVMMCEPGLAATGSDARSGDRSASSNKQHQQRYVQGRLESYRTAQLQGEREPHVLGKIRLDNGRTVVVNLGPVSNLQQRDLRLRANQQVQATGVEGRINGLPVLVVDRFTGDGKVTMIAFASSRKQQSQQQNRQQSDARMQQGSDRQRSTATSSSRSRTLVLASGRLTDVRDVDMRGLPASHRLGKMQTRSGRSVIVDFGRRQSLGDIRLDRGEQVSVIGTVGKINGKPVIFASHVADLATIDRSDDPRQSQSSQRDRQRQNQSDNSASRSSSSRR